MAALYRIFLLLSVALASAAPRSLRQKRSLMDLAHLFDCSLTENVSSYIIYGCYCGPGGEGQPMDEADRCCFLHDCCYGKVEGDCEPKLKGYNWTCKKKSAECEDSEDTCERKVCECDRALVECLKTKPYNGTNFGQRLLGLCGDKKPACL